MGRVRLGMRRRWAVVGVTGGGSVNLRSRDHVPGAVEQRSARLWFQLEHIGSNKAVMYILPQIARASLTHATPPPDKFTPVDRMWLHVACPPPMRGLHLPLWQLRAQILPT